MLEFIVCIVSCLRTGQSEIRIPLEANIVPFSNTSRPALWSTEFPVQWISGVGAPSLENKGPGHADYHSLHLALMFRMSGAISPIPMCAYMACVGENHFHTYNLSESSDR
jgi:hypothetical protein